MMNSNEFTEFGCEGCMNFHFNETHNETRTERFDHEARTCDIGMWQHVMQNIRCSNYRIS